MKKAAILASPILLSFLFLSLISLSTILLFSCAKKEGEVAPQVDFTGVWVRESDTVISTLDIDQKGKEVKFLWKAEAKDGSWKIESREDGECDKVQNGGIVEHYSFSVGFSENGRRLSVNWIARNLQAKEIVPFVDEIELAPGGKELISRAVEFDEKGAKVYTGEEYRFVKAIDSHLQQR